jgi:polyphosphate kinase 2 (PPK2 family)
MDAAGKDSTISAVMRGVDPSGCQVFSFKKPSSLELDHDFLWRTACCLPERGRIGLRYPVPSKEERASFAAARQVLEDDR